MDAVHFGNHTEETQPLFEATLNREPANNKAKATMFQAIVNSDLLTAFTSRTSIAFGGSQMKNPLVRHGADHFTHKAS